MTKELLIWLRGEQFDLNDILHQFVEGEGFSILLENQRYAIHLKSGDLPQTFDIARSTAKFWVTMLNGVCGAFHGQFQNVEIDVIELVDENGERHRDNSMPGGRLALGWRGIATLGDGSEARTRLRGWIDAARTNSRVADALRFWAMERDWYNLHKVWEIIRDDVGGIAALVATAWVSVDDSDSFKNTANDYLTLGDAARHARIVNTTRPLRPITRDQAEEIVGVVLTAWLDAKSHQIP
jgi:hypothetical protein